ncbi:integrator complex subunit 2 [Harmonia axyridis]|uniref:integrator complex subunit 2 n=1 Tax=Harmonia axyridis TaxID=115357 RepID=UPI001E278511|nr:integrator complex subunit 2 [Harmonia axyridis]
MTFCAGVNPKVFSAIQNVDMNELAKCTEQEIRPVLPCLVRMGLISPLDTSKKCTNMKIDILTIVSGMELVNSIVALLSIDFHKLEVDVRKEQQLRQKGNTCLNDSILIGNLINTSMALEYERSDMTRRLSILLGELLYIQTHIQESLDSNNENDNYIKASDLFDNDIFSEELSDIICIALAELPTTLNIINIIEILLHVHNGYAIICRIVANFPDSFKEVSTFLIQSGEKQEESISSLARASAISLLCTMNPSQALTVRNKCVELCRMPALAITLSLEHCNKNPDSDDSDIVAFISGLLLGNDQSIRNWIALFIRTGQKRKGEVPSNALQQLRDELLHRLQVILDASMESHLPDNMIVQASALLRLYCALRGIAAIKFQDEEVNLIIKLLTSHPSPTPAGVRFVSIGLCMLIACPSLISLQEHERKSIEWVQWLVKEEAYFESASGVTASFGEMLLLMAIHFHSNQLSAICDLVCATLGMKIPIRHNNMTRMKQVFTQEIFTEQVVTAHAIKVPVTNNLNANMTGFLPIHCIHQLLKSRAFAKHNVNIKNWIYRQICTSISPLHSVLPLLVEVFVNSIIVPTNKNTEHTNKPLTENEIRKVFQSSIFGQYFDQKKSIFTMDFDNSIEDKNVVVDNTSLTPQLLLLYYLLLYEDCRLNNAQVLAVHNRKVKIYSSEFMSELPIKYLLHHAQKDQSSYSVLFGPLLKLLATHFPHLALVEDWLDDMSMTIDSRPEHISEMNLIEAFNNIEENSYKITSVFQTLLKHEPIDIWPFAEIFTFYARKILGDKVPRFIQDLYKDIWLRMNTVLPRRLWVLTVKNLVDDFSSLTRIDVAEDPLQILRCDERIFRCAPLYAIVLRVLRASLASSRSQLLQHLQANPKLDSNGQVVVEPDRESICKATIDAQESAAVQMLLESCLETEQDTNVPGQQWALQEVRSLVCSYIHQVFIADAGLATLVHFQGYPCELLAVTVKGIPSMHICADFIVELMQQPSLKKQIFAIQLLSHLSVQYALPKNLNNCVTALNLLYALLGGLSCGQRIKLFTPILPVLVRISEAFPPLVPDIMNLLMQLAKTSESQASLASHFDAHLGKSLEISAQDSRELCDLIQKTFSQILDRAVLKPDVYKPNNFLL